MGSALGALRFSYSCKVTQVKFAIMIFKNAEVSPTTIQLTCLGVTMAFIQKNSKKISLLCMSQVFVFCLVGRSAVDSCPEVVNFFIVQLI